MKRALKKSILTVLSLTLLVFTLNAKESKKNSIEKKSGKKESPSLFKMAPVKGGWFTMGKELSEISSSDKFSEFRKHRVYVSDFSISTSEITQELYEEIMEDNPSVMVGKYKPVILKNFLDYAAFCNKLSLRDKLTPCYSWNGKTDTAEWPDKNADFGKVFPQIECNFDADGYRLPTEAEWMYAAKGGPGNENFKYSGSDDISQVSVSHYTMDNGQTSEYKSPEDVKTKLPNGLGLYDMTGNAPELVWDVYGIFPSYDTVNYKGFARTYYYARPVLKGGAYNDLIGNCALEDRITGYSFDNTNAGFRVCRSIINDDVKAKTASASEEALKSRNGFINTSLYSKCTVIPRFSYTDYPDREVDFKGLVITKEPVNYEDLLLISYDYSNSENSVTTLNAISCMNELSRFSGLEPVYTFGYMSGSGFIPFTDEKMSLSDSSKEIYVKADRSRSGFRFISKEELDGLNRYTSLSYVEQIKSCDIIPFTSDCGLPLDLICNKENDEEIYKPESSFLNKYFYICRNLPDDKNEVLSIKKSISNATEVIRKERLKNFEIILGASLESFMKEVKGGQTLLSVDNKYSDKSFIDVKTGSYFISEIPFSNRMRFALNLSYNNGSYNYNNEPLEMNWYEAAYLCNYLSWLYGYDKVYSFNYRTVDTDYTKNGFRIHSEAEWENAARSSTNDKNEKCGVPLDKVNFYGNKSYYDFNPEFEDCGWTPREEFSITTAEANGLGLRGMTDYCSEWCNDNQFFSYKDFSSDKNLTYSVSSYDSKPYSIKNMPYGQVYSPEKVVKGHSYYSVEDSDFYISARSSSSLNESCALRLVRTKNPEEMKKLIKEHNNEYASFLSSCKSFFDQNLKMIPVKGGTYNKREKDGSFDFSEKITVKDFELSETEITNKMFIRLMHYNPNIKNIPEDKNDDSDGYNSDQDAPVSSVTPLDAMMFCNELSRMYGYTPYYNFKKSAVNKKSDGFRLPEETEWLWAAMESNSKYKALYSGNKNADNAGVFNKKMPQSVKSKQPNKSGFFDLSGNVREIVHCPVVWENKPGLTMFTSKGGCYDDPSSMNSIYYQYDLNVDGKNTRFGFRIARNIPLTK